MDSNPSTRVLTLRGRSNKERGASLIEAALIMPIMVALLLGTMEIGLAFKSYLTVSYAAREGARAAALSGNNLDTDCFVVTTIVDALGSNQLDDLQRVEIYHVNPSTGSAYGPGSTNTWTFVGPDPYDCAGDWSVSETWPSTARKTSFAPGSQLDIVGVRIVWTHTYITGFPPFNGDIDIDEKTITRIEPESFE